MFEENRRREKETENSIKPQQSLAKLNSNLARLKNLKDQQRLREKERKNNPKSVDNESQVYYLGKKNEKKPIVADDEFTVDCDVLSIGADSKSTEVSEEQKAADNIKQDQQMKKHSGAAQRKNQDSSFKTDSGIKKVTFSILRK